MSEDIEPDVLSVDEDDKVSTQEQLSEALENEKSAITIEDSYMGTKVAISMTLVDCAHHSALLAAIGSILCTHGIHESLIPFGRPLAAVSAITHIGYYALWKRCPLSHYRITSRATVYRLLKKETQPNTMIVRETEPKCRTAHVLVSLAAVVMAFWQDAAFLGEKLQGVFYGAGEDAENNLSETSPSIVDRVKGVFKRNEMDYIQI